MYGRNATVRNLATVSFVISINAHIFAASIILDSHTTDNLCHISGKDSLTHIEKFISTTFSPEKAISQTACNQAATAW